MAGATVTATSSAATNTQTEEPPDPITLRARMKVTDYRGSAYFRQDNSGFGFRVFVGLLFLAGCAYFSLPWSLTKEPPRFDGPLDVVHFVVAWGAVPIFVLAFVGISYARRALADFGVNLAIAQHVEKSAAAKLQEIRRDPRVRSTVSRLESDHLPDNPSDPKPASWRLFQRICAEALDRRFESTINLIEPYQRESMEPAYKLEAVQRAALRWGILCHFIGLVLVINAVPAMMKSAETFVGERPAQAIAVSGAPSEGAIQTESSDLAIGKVLEGLRLAFGASVGGLSVSLFAAMLLSSVRKKQFAYFRKLDEATATMISLATNSLNNDELLVSLQQMSERLQEQTITVKEGILTLASAIASQAKTIDDGLKSLGDGKIKLDAFLKGISESHGEFLKRLNTYYDVSAIGAVAEAISKKIETSQNRTVTTLKSDIQAIREVVAGVEQTTSLHLGGDLFRFVPHALIALAGVSAVTLIMVLWKLL